MLAEIVESVPQMPPLARFAVALIIFLTTPALCRKLRLPAVVGLLAAGVLIGPSGIQVAPKNAEVANFFADIGKLLLMFFAGLEIDLTQFQKVRRRSLAFGAASFGFPLVMGVGLGLAFGYGILSALLIGSVFASHTLLGYPIVQRLGLVRNEAVTVTIGATIFTDIAALLVVAVCIPIYTTGFSPASFAIQILELAIYIPVVLIVLSQAAHFLMRRFHASKEGQMLVMLLIVVVAAIAAEEIHLEGIIGVPVGPGGQPGSGTQQGQGGSRIPGQRPIHPGVLRNHRLLDRRPRLWGHDRPQPRPGLWHRRHADRRQADRRGRDAEGPRLHARRGADHVGTCAAAGGGDARGGTNRLQRR